MVLLIGSECQMLIMTPANMPTTVRNNLRRRAVAADQGEGAKDAWCGIPTLQVSWSGAEISGYPCRCIQSIQPGRHL